MTEPGTPVGRGVMSLPVWVLQELLNLPAGMEVLHVVPGRYGLYLDVVVRGPGIPQGPDGGGGALFELQPSYQRTPEGRVELTDLGL